MAIIYEVYLNCRAIGDRIFTKILFIFWLTFLILSQIYTIFPRTNKEKSAPGLAGRIISLTKFKKL